MPENLLDLVHSFVDVACEALADGSSRAGLSGSSSPSHRIQELHSGDMPTESAEANGKRRSRAAADRTQSQVQNRRR